MCLCVFVGMGGGQPEDEGSWEWVVMLSDNCLNSLTVISQRLTGSMREKTVFSFSLLSKAQLTVNI